MDFKSRKLQIYAILIAAAVIFATIAFIGVEPPANTVVVENIEFVSAQSSPISAVRQLAGSESFIISAQVHDPVTGADTLLFNSAALFIVVLSGNEKNVIQLFRIVDQQGNLSYCLTNHGELTTEERLSVEECNSLLAGDGPVKILINPANSSLSQPRISFSGDSVTIEADKVESTSNAAFTLLKTMFSNAEEVISKSNAITSQLG